MGRRPAPHPACGSPGTPASGPDAPPPLLARRAFHVALLVAGTLFLLTGAFHGNIWFDESYSVAIARHSFAEIWDIGTFDVHPVLIYWALHALSLLFGESILVYRLFVLFGAVALALLGYTHIRRDFGWMVGLVFSLLALFMPYCAAMAVEIRMYSWATFAVMLCAVYAYRIVVWIRAGGEHALMPLRYWGIFAVSSLASAYLHYFGMLAAFAINVALGVYLVVRYVRARPGARGPELGHPGSPGARSLGSPGARGPGTGHPARPGPGGLRKAPCRREGICFLVSTVGQVTLYAPWLFALMGQVEVVSYTYWANFEFPTSLVELATYPIMTSQLSFAVRGAYGGAVQGAVAVLLAVLALAGVGVLAAVGVRWQGAGRPCGEGVRAALLSLGLYLAPFALSLAASGILGSYLLYYRYVFVAIGPLLLAVSLLVAQVEGRLGRAALRLGCMAFLAISLIGQALLVHDSYAAKNQAPLAYFEQQVQNGEPVLSSDIGIEGVTAVLYPETPQTYLDWQPGRWGLAYRAYSPPLASIASWDEALSGYRGRFVVLGASPGGSMPKDIADIRDLPGISLITSQTFYRPYERTYFTIAVMEK